MLKPSRTAHQESRPVLFIQVESLCAAAMPALCICGRPLDAIVCSDLFDNVMAVADSFQLIGLQAHQTP